MYKLKDIKSWFFWIYKNNATNYCTDIECLRNLTKCVIEDRNKTELLDLDQLEYFYNHKFLPIANKVAKRGFSYININELLFYNFGTNYRQYKQIINFLKDKGYSNPQLFYISWS